MKNRLLVCLALVLFSCVPPSDVSDEELLRFVWQNHAWPGFSFQFFQDSIHVKRTELDVNGDGRREIALLLLSGTRNVGDFLILSAHQGHLAEWFFTRKTAHYALEMDFELFQSGIRLRWLERGGGSNVRVTSVFEEFIRCAQQVCSSLPYERYVWSFAFGSSETETDTNLAVTHASFTDDTITLQQHHYRAGLMLHRQTCYDQTGAQWGMSFSQPFTYLGPEILTVYRWNGQSFEQLSRRETRPQVNSLPLKNDSIFRGLLHVLHDRWYSGTNIPNRIEQDFLHFFGLETPPVPPCGEPFDRLSLASEYRDGVGVEVVRAGQSCRLQAWRQPDWRTVASLDEIEILGRSDFSCHPDTIRLMWEDLTNDGVPEIGVSSVDDFQETLYFFQILPTWRKLGQISGFLREPNFRGVEWEERGGRLLFYTGLPFWNNEACRTSLSCYSAFENAFTCWEWRLESNRFLPCAQP